MTQEEKQALEACRAYFRHVEAYELKSHKGANTDKRMELKAVARTALQQVYGIIWSGGRIDESATSIETDEPWDDEFMNEMGGQAVQTDVGNIEWQFGKGVCVSDTGCLFIGHQEFGGVATKQKLTQLLSLLRLRPHDPLI